MYIYIWSALAIIFFSGIICVMIVVNKRRAIEVKELEDIFMQSDMLNREDKISVETVRRNTIKRKHRATSNVRLQKKRDEDISLQDNQEIIRINNVNTYVEEVEIKEELKEKRISIFSKISDKFSRSTQRKPLEAAVLLSEEEITDIEEVSFINASQEVAVTSPTLPASLLQEDYEAKDKLNVTASHHFYQRSLLNSELVVESDDKELSKDRFEGLSESKVNISYEEIAPLVINNGDAINLDLLTFETADLPKRSSRQVRSKKFLWLKKEEK